MTDLAKNNKRVSISHAAEILGISLDTLRRWDKEGVLKATRGDNNTRFFLLEEVEKLKFSQPVSISQAAEMLGLSTSTLRRLENKNIITPKRNEKGERVYDRKALEKFLHSEYFLRQKDVEGKILEPLAEPKKEPDDSLRSDMQGDLGSKAKGTRELREGVTSKILGTVVAKQEDHIKKLLSFRKMFYFTGVFLATVFVLLVILFTILFLVYPEATSRFLGYTKPPVTLARGTTPGLVLGAKSPAEFSNAQGTVLGKALKPFGQVALGVVSQVNPQLYEKIVPKKPIEDVNDVFTMNEQGNLMPYYNLAVSDSSYLQIPDKGLIANLNAELVQGRAPGGREGNLAVLGRNSTIEGLSVAATQVTGSFSSAQIADSTIATVDLADGSVATAKLADSAVTSTKISDGTIVNADISDSAAISDGKLAQITAGNKVEGSAVQLSSSGGLVNSSGLSLTRSCSNGQVLGWNSTSGAWECTTAGGSGDITSVTAGTGLSGGGTSGDVTLTATLGTSVTLTSEVDGVLPIANGGTNKALTLAAGGIIYSDADSFEITSAGTSGQCLQSSGGSAPTWGTCGSSGVTSLNSLTGALSVAGAGINTVSAVGSTITVTGTEADTLSAVTGRGATTSTTVALNGGLTSTSSTPISLSSTSPTVSIGNTGTLTVTDGTNTLLSVADNGTTGTLSVNAATISSLNTAGAIVYTNTSGVLGISAQGTSGQCLVSGGSGTPTWGACGGGSGDITSIGDVTSGAAFDGTQGNSLQFEGSTANDFEITLTAADPGADFTINLPALTGTVALLEGTQTFSGAKTFSATSTFDGLITANGNVTLGNATTDRLTVTSQVLGASPLVFQGAVDDTITTTLAFTEPATSSKTITFPNATGTVAVSATTPIAISALGDITCTTCLTSVSGGTFAITLAGTSGTQQTINAGDTISIAAGAGITTTGGATDTVTIASTLGTSVDLTSEVTGILPIANGGTNTTTTPTAGALAYGTGTAYAFSLAGTSGQCLVSGGTGSPTWSSCGAGGSSAWSALTDPSTNLSLIMGSNTTSFTFNAATGANNLFTFIDTANNTGTGYIIDLETASGSNAKPLRVVSRGNTIIDTTAAGALTLGTSGSTVTVAAPATFNENLTLAANKNLALSSGTGTISQTFSNSSASSADSRSVTNANTGLTATTVNGLDLSLTNSTNTNSTNTLNGINFNAASNNNSNTINGIKFASATGFTNFLDTPSLDISSAGILSGATGLTSSGEVTFSGLNTAGAVVYTNGSGVLGVSGQGAANQCLLSGGSGTPTWGSCASGSTSASWSSLTAPSANLSLNHAEYTSAFTWDRATDTAFDGLTLALTNDFGTDTTTQRVLVLKDNNTTGGGTTETLLRLDHADADSTLTDGIQIVSTGTGSITDAIDVSDGAILNAINIGPNTIKGTTGIIDLDNFDVDANGTVTIGDGQSYTGINNVTLSSGGGGNLTLNSSSNTVTLHSTDTAINATGLATLTSSTALNLNPNTGTSYTLNTSATTLDLFNTNPTTVNFAGGATTALNIGSTTGAAATTIQGGTGNITLTAGGAGDTVVTSDFNTGLLVGSSSNTPAPLSVSGGIGSNASFIVNNANSGDLITASASGTTKFTVSNGGNITVATSQGLDCSTASCTLLVGDTNATTITVGGTNATGRTLNLATGTGADTVNIATGATSADSVVLGNTAVATTLQLRSAANGDGTSSAVSLVDNSLTTGTGLDISSTGVITTGGDLALLTANSLTTGNVLRLSSTAQTSGTGISVTGGGANLAAGGELVDLQMGAATAGNGMNVTTTGAYTGTGLVALTANSITSGKGLSLDSASNAFTGTLANISLTGNNAANTGTLLKVSNGSGTSNANTVAMITNGGTGPTLRVNDDGTDTDASPFVIDALGNAGLGTPSPIGQLHVTRPQTAGVNGKALAIFDQIENQDILTASVSGATKFTVSNTGNITVATSQGLDCSTASCTLLVGDVNATTLSLANGSTARAINIGNGVSGNTIAIGNGVNTSAQTVSIANGASGANSTVNILSGVATAGTQTLNLGTGASAKTINIGNSTGATGVKIDSGTGDVDIDATGTGADFLVDAAGAISLDATGANSNYTVTGSGLTLSLEALGGGANQVILNSAGTSASAIDLNATGTVSGNAITLDTTDGGIQLTSGGAGETTLVTDFNSGVNIGASTNTPAPLSVSGGIGSNASFIVNNVNSGDLITASASGVTKFTVSNAGVVTLAGAQTEDITTQSNNALTIKPGGTGALTLNSTNNLANAIYLRANGGTSETVRIHADQGTGVGSLDLLSDVGGISLTATGLASNDAINLSAVAGGVDIDAAAAFDVDIAGGQVLISSKDNAASAIALTTNVGTSETIVLTNTQGTGVGAIGLTSTAGGITVTAGLGTADAININASNAAGGIDIDSGTGGIIADTTGLISLDSTNVGNSNFTVNASNADLTLEALGGGTNQVILNSAGTSTSAIDINATGTVNGNAITLDTTNGGIALTAAGSTNGDVTLTAGDDITIDASAEGSYLQLIAGDNEATSIGAANDIELKAEDDVIVALTAAGQFVVDAATNIDSTVNSNTDGTVSLAIDANPGDGGTNNGLYINYEAINNADVGTTTYRGFRVDFTNSEGAAADNTYVLSLNNATGSSVTDGLVVLENTDAINAVGAGVLFLAGGAGTDFTYGIDLDGANIGTADIRFENSGTLDEATAGTWTFKRSSDGTVVIASADGADANTPLTINSAGTGALTLDPAGAGSIVVGSADVTSMTFTTDNNATNDIAFTGGVTFNNVPTVGDGSGNDYLSFTEEGTNPTCAVGDYKIWANNGAGENKLKKCQNGSLSDLDAAGAWSAISGPTGNSTVDHQAFSTTFDWSSTGALNAWIFDLNNTSSTATTQNLVTLNNAQVDTANTDNNTENILLLQQLDTATGDSNVVDNALKIDVAGAAGMTDGIEITNSAGNLTNGINIVDTAGGTLTTGILMSGTFTNYIDAPNFDVSNAGVITLAGAQAADITTQSNNALTLKPGGTGALVFSTSNTSASALDLNATGTVAGNAITLDTTDGGIALTAGGAVNGDITLTVGDDFTLNGVGSSVYTIGASTTTGTITIGGTAQTGNITLGSSSGTNTVIIGNGTGATTVQIAPGATNAKTVQIATGAVANTVTIGSTTGAAATTIQSGTGDMLISSTDALTLDPTGSLFFDNLATGAGNDAVCIDNAGAGIWTVSRAAACGVSSARFKHDIESLKGGLDVVNALRPASYTYNEDQGGRAAIGFIAEEVNEIEKRVIIYDEDGITPQTIDYSKLTAWLALAIQELDLKVEDIKANQVAGLETVSAKTVKLDNLQALSGGDIVLTLIEDGKFVVKDTDNKEVIKFDDEGNGYFAGTITADRVKARQIEGIEVITDQLTSLSQQVENLSTGANTLASANTLDLVKLAQKSDTELAEKLGGDSNQGSVLGSQTPSDASESSAQDVALSEFTKATSEGALSVEREVTFKQKSLFAAIVEFFSNVIFHGDVLFKGRPTFNKDTAGFAVIKEGSKQVRITFEKEYASKPVVTSNAIWDISEEDLSKLTQSEMYLLQKQDFVVAAVNTKGFTIVLDKASVVDLKFSWTALAVEGTSTSESAASIIPSPSVDEQAKVEIKESMERATEVSPTPTPTEENKKTITVSDNELGFLRVREASNADSKEVGQVSPKENFEVLGEENGWYQIEYASGKTGWVSGSYVTVN